jgi:ribosomal protein L16 Arg81 hydroxylase
MYSIEWLFQPISPATFFQDYYEQKSLHVTRGQPGYFGSLLSVKAIDQMLAGTSPRISDLFLVDAARELTPENYTFANSEPPGRIDVPRVYELFRTGATISVSYLHERMPQLAALCEAMEKPFSQHFQTNIYLSPPNAQGFKTHFDNHDVLVLQVSGSKVWTLYDSIELPLQGQRFDPDKHIAGPATSEFVLNAGDMFYCPRGVYHSARSTDETSLHITLGLIGKTWADLMMEALSEVCVSSVAFRRNLPAGFANGDFDAARANGTFRALLEEFVAKAQFAPVLERMADDFATSRRPVLPGGLQELSGPEITARSKVAPRPNLMCRLRAKDAEIRLLFGSSEITFPVFVGEALDFCIKGPAFLVREVPDSLDEAGKVVLVRRLVKEGVLVRVDEDVPARQKPELTMA